MDLKAKIREIPDFPQPGVSFKDITTLLKDGEALKYVIQMMAKPFRESGPDLICGVESRGFLLGAPLAYELGVGFVLIRKPGKLPGAKETVEYSLEYGQDALEIHQDAISPGQRILLVDDLLATGGTIAAAAKLVEKLGGRILGLSFLVELTYLNGRDKIKGQNILSLVKY
ncbi:MAG: adenine phosphoribosyltransferase [Firmicutes bacterium]|nr:adenine phosphoribosyltransferase [Bacillota bacterium]